MIQFLVGNINNINLILVQDAVVQSFNFVFQLADLLLQSLLHPSDFLPFLAQGVGLPVVDPDLRPLDANDVLDALEIVALHLDFPRRIIDEHFGSQLAEHVRDQELIEQDRLVLLQWHRQAQVELTYSEDLDDMLLSLVQQLK